MPRATAVVAEKYLVHFPPEIELSRFTEGLKNINPTWNSSTPGCMWSGIQCKDSTRPDDVPHIQWQRLQLQGTPGWKYIPQSLQHLNMFANFLTGELPLDFLPHNLKSIYLGSNMHSGPLCTHNLPGALSEA